MIVKRNKRFGSEKMKHGVGKRPNCPGLQNDTYEASGLFDRCPKQELSRYSNQKANKKTNTKEISIICTYIFKSIF